MTKKIPLRHKIITVRKLKGWHQAELAEKSGIHRVYISYIETGNALPTPEQLIAIEAALGIQFNDPAVEAAFAVLGGNNGGAVAPAGIEARRAD